MIQKLPSELAHFKSALKNVEIQKQIKDLEFSGSTYQVLVEDLLSKKDFWVFLQLDVKGGIYDAFCSCEESHSLTPCLHLAIAYLSLFDAKTKQPLHVRFAHSIWNILCRLYEARLGNSAEDLFIQEGQTLFHRSSTGKRLFTMRFKEASTAQLVHQLIYGRTKETEETSLKFSNLTSDELLSWKEGHPNPGLRYDLSFWCDLAKWLMAKQEAGENYHIDFDYSKRGIPNRLKAEFDDLFIEFYLSEANLPSIVEFLTETNCRLAVHHEGEKGISKVLYHAEEHLLEIVPKVEKDKKKKKQLPSVEGLSLGEWLFVPGDGFYALEAHELLRHPKLYGEDIVAALNDHGRLLRRLIGNSTITLDPMRLSYHMHFDRNFDLHIEAFLLEPGDLFKSNSWVIEQWAYLEDEGFYAIEGNLFEWLRFTIPSQKVSTFVTEHRSWLNEQQGFQTHVRSLEFELDYQMTKNDRLVFKKTISKKKKGAVLFDFGAWIYWKGSGFYSKREHSFSHLLDSGVSLPTTQIPLFIRLNREELKLVSGFFSSEAFVKSAHLKIEYIQPQIMRISPDYELTPGCSSEALKVFDDVAYLEGHGFYVLPPELQLPEKYNHAVDLQGAALIEFLKSGLENLEPYVKTIDPRFVKPAKYVLKIQSIQYLPEKGKGWYGLQFFYETERGTVELYDILEAMRQKKGYGFFQAGLIDLSAESFNWLRSFDQSRVDPQTHIVMLNSLELMRIQAFSGCEVVTTDPESLSIFEHLRNLSPPEKPDLTGLQSVLRPYQANGVDWLWFLYSEQLSGLLCDDMGLGKTHQTMGLLAGVTNFIHKHAEGVKGLFLIVCPTSVLYHWEEKLSQFLPHLKVYTFYGMERSIENFHDQYDILLTSYGILRNEREAIAKIHFEVALFDEIQVAKNQYSLIYSALHLVDAGTKIGLTGTPIENRLRELKSLFDIVLPGYLPGEKEFRELFIKPIEKQESPERRELLSRLIKPFVMRRKKENVLKDLPEKIEEIAHCDLEAFQAELYHDVLTTRRHQLVEDLQDERKAVPYLHVFALLSSLKQICDHPAVYLKQTERFEEYPSGKWELFKELLSEARESQQKVVVFSQYLGMLDIMERYLIQENVTFASVRGATINRKNELKKFKDDPECSVFLGSLQAAGLGIDLTSASVVIHYDRWWNAARENQATDRVYRMGQTRGVQVFKLVTKGSFEERIHHMIERKKRLLEDVLGVDDQDYLKQFSRNELLELLT